MSSPVARLQQANTRSSGASQDEVATLLKGVSQRMNVEARCLDHAVWAYRGGAQVPNRVIQSPVLAQRTDTLRRERGASVIERKRRDERESAHL